MPNQSMAKKSAALEMCKHLYSIGELDENLLPRRQPKANLN
jgi:hypothetical protein